MKRPEVLLKFAVVLLAASFVVIAHETSPVIIKFTVILQLNLCFSVGHFHDRKHYKSF